MLIKERDFPLFVQILQALLRRLPSNHPKVPLIQENLAKSIAGFKSEQAIDYPLSFLPTKSFYIFHDLRLKTKSHYFQLDSIIVTLNYVLILEVTNLLANRTGINKGKRYSLPF
jgi:hypothetical protein